LLGLSNVKSKMSPHASTTLTMTMRENGIPRDAASASRNATANVRFHWLTRSVVFAMNVSNCNRWEEQHGEGG
jgi:hypothetical protein